MFIYKLTLPERSTSSRMDNLSPSATLSGIPESNRRHHLGKVAYYHYTNPAFAPILSLVSEVLKSVRENRSVVRGVTGRSFDIRGAARAAEARWGKFRRWRWGAAGW